MERIRNRLVRALGTLVFAGIIAFASLGITPAFSLTFWDVDGDTPHSEDIQWLADTGISEGYPDGSFGGMLPVYRQDMAAFLRRLSIQMGDTEAAKWKPADYDWRHFDDIDENVPHVEDILWLAHYGISTGYWDGSGSCTYRPMEPVYRQDMAAFLRRLAKHLEDPDSQSYKERNNNPRYFKDVDFPMAHCRDVWWLYDFGIANGYSDGTFRGMTYVYRQDMAAFLRRFNDRIKPPAQPEAQYSYEIYEVGPRDRPLIASMNNIIYIKTDSPDPMEGFEIRIDGERAWPSSVKCDDIVADGDGTYYNGLLKVKGGYVGSLSFEGLDGRHVLSIEEPTNDRLHPSAVAAEISVDIKTPRELENQWIEERLAADTTPEMNSLEKLNAIQFGFKYHTTKDGKYVYLAKEQNTPFYVTGRASSATSPAAICEVANYIGGFDEVHNCYYDYAMGTSGWSTWHAYAWVVFEGQKYYFMACPSSSTGEVSDEELAPIDFSSDEYLTKLG